MQGTFNIRRQYSRKYFLKEGWVDANKLLNMAVSVLILSSVCLGFTNIETPIILKSRTAIINKTLAAVVIRMLEADMTRNQFSLVGKFITWD
jgi:hypothetical protein